MATGGTVIVASINGTAVEAASIGAIGTAAMDFVAAGDTTDHHPILQR
jgi:uncharacterized membrane-anchored protein